MIIDLLSRVYWENGGNHHILSVYDYMVAVDYNLDHDSITDEVEYGWTADEVFARFHVINHHGKYVLILPKPRLLLPLYDKLEEEESYLI